MSSCAPAPKARQAVNNAVSRRGASRGAMAIGRRQYITWDRPRRRRFIVRCLQTGRRRPIWRAWSQTLSGVSVMPKIEVYSTAVCPYCVAAKNLLKSKGLQWNEVRVDADPAQRDLMLQRSGGRRTVPQIFVNDQHVGGYDDLVAADRSGRLKQLLDEAA